MVEKLRWIREKGEKNFIKDGGETPTMPDVEEGEKKWLLLAKECFELVETIATRKKII